MNTLETAFRSVLTVLILISLSIPLVVMLRFELSQWEVFRETWLFIVYAFIIFMLGSSFIGAIWGKK